jgi:hypothetical protein
MVEARSETNQDAEIGVLRERLEESEARLVGGVGASNGASCAHTCSGRRAPAHPPRSVPLVSLHWQAEARGALVVAEGERDEQVAQVRKLLGDAARLQEQLTSATGDIFTLQVWGGGGGTAMRACCRSCLPKQSSAAPLTLDPVHPHPLIVRPRRSS